MSDAVLTPHQLRAWRAFRKVGDLTTAAVTRDLTEATGLSGAEYGVLGYLVEAGQGTLRQVELAEGTGWHKSRLSHLLSRMEARGLVERRPAGKKGVFISATELGRELQQQAKPVHERAVWRYFAQHLRPEQLDALLEIAEQLGAGAEEASEPT